MTEPYDGNPANVDAWSAAVFARLQAWPVAMGGAWTRWSPGYLVLTVKEFDGRSVDPIFLDTGNDELTVTFGYWECHLDGPDHPGAQDNLASSSAEAIRLIEDWLAGRICTAVYYSADDKWCGTVTIDPDQIPQQLAGSLEWLSKSGPTRIELRTPERAHWRFFRIQHDGAITETTCEQSKLGAGSA